MGTILHISDLHFGKPYQSEVGEAVLNLEQSLCPNLTVCSGDIVQWAESRPSWDAARDFFGRMTRPYLTIPGNHDLPRAFFWKRAANLFELYERGLGTTVDSCFYDSELIVAGVATGTPWSFDLGSISLKQLDWLDRLFEPFSNEFLKVVVQHQAPKAPHPSLIRSHCWNDKRALQRFQRAGVDLILSGHNHFSHFEVISPHTNSKIFWSQAGTTTSRRLKKSNCSTNTCHVINFTSKLLELAVYAYSPASGSFEARSHHSEALKEGN